MGHLVGRFVGYLVGRLLGYLVEQMVGCFVGQIVGMRCVVVYYMVSFHTKYRKFVCLKLVFCMDHILIFS